MNLTKEALKRFFPTRRLDNPFSFLGPRKHPGKKTTTVRAILPFAQQAYVHFPGQPDVWYEMHRLCDTGLWQAVMPLVLADQSYGLHTVEADGVRADFLDTYAFDASYITEHDKKLFGEGNHYRIYEILGAHKQTCRGIEGVNFAVWAPNALAVNLVADFNRWEGAGHPLRFDADSGIWELFVPAIGCGERYKFEITPPNGPRFLKSDPYAFYMETAPATESVVYQIDDSYQWHDDEWMQQRRRTDVWRTPISIYEVHLGSWMRGEGKRLLNYIEIAARLIPYVKDMGFTHIEILPIAEYPYEPSWGYQVSNFYAPTSRLGKPEELMAFIDQCHQNGIGVLLDWVAGHFPKDAHALARFDGTHLYEHEDPRKGEHKDWGTLIFNYGRHEAENFLVANALFWLDHYHFDGLRVDAVASMLYLDYSRKDGEWIPNIYGGNENLEAIEFLKHTNYVVHGRFPGVMMIAEESTNWAGVSWPTDAGGLGFGFKWNMGWMHDILAYLQTPPEYRPFHHNRLTFVFQYAYEENFILSLSHDEVVHLKGSLYTKMPGREWEKFANLRLLFFLMYTHPGKKLNFMGAEFAQIDEWNESAELQWHLLENDNNRRLQLFFKTLNRLYRSVPVLYEMDCRPAGFSWIDANNQEQSIIVFSRQAKDPRIALIVVINFSAISRFNHRIGVPYPVSYTEIFNSNDARFGGLSERPAGTIYTLDETPWHGQEFSIRIDRLPALGALLLKPAAPLESQCPDP
ncbi:MAG: 1,4-alpha-glucan branching protein GlgB [Gammaproteobacteria bacterium]